VTNWFFWLSLVALLATKTADVVSTWCHVGVEGETNPLVRPLFRRLGLRRGIVAVCAVYVVLAVGQYLLVWQVGWPLLLWSNGVLGFVIAWIQWDVARFNSTGRHSAVTRFALRVYTRWGRGSSR
jgi:hypothetical protein